VTAASAGDFPDLPGLPDLPGAEAVDAAAGALLPRLKERPAVAVVLGSGLGGLAGEVADPVRVEAAEIPGMPVPRVAGHTGLLLSGRLAGVPVLVLAGRVHTYEGYSAAEVAFAVRVAARAGCHALLATNAAGGLNPDFAPGDLMVLADHINLLGDNPLWGAPAFVDMIDAYDPELRSVAARVGSERGMPLREGVYVAMPGPSYETRAEAAMLRGMGADAVGMSTVPEVIAARAHGLRVAAISVITNRCGEPTTHEEVLEVTERARPHLRDLVLALLRAA
jgi:purine-nucleoside phosphorylase